MKRKEEFKKIKNEINSFRTKYLKISHVEMDVTKIIKDIISYVDYCDIQYKEKFWISKKTLSKMEDSLETLYSNEKEYNELVRKYAEIKRKKEELIRQKTIITSIINQVSTFKSDNTAIKNLIDNFKKYISSININDENKYYSHIDYLHKKLKEIDNLTNDYSDILNLLKSKNIQLKKVEAKINEISEITSRIKSRKIKLQRDFSQNISMYQVLMNNLENSINDASIFEIYTKWNNSIKLLNLELSAAKNQESEILNGEKQISSWSTNIREISDKLKSEDINQLKIKNWVSSANGLLLGSDFYSNIASINKMKQDAQKLIDERREELRRIEEEKRRIQRKKEEEARRKREEEEEEERRARRRREEESNSWSSGSSFGGFGSSVSGSSFGGFGGGDSGGGGASGSF